MFVAGWAARDCGLLRVSRLYCDTASTANTRNFALPGDWAHVRNLHQNARNGFDIAAHSMHGAAPLIARSFVLHELE